MQSVFSQNFIYPLCRVFTPPVPPSLFRLLFPVDLFTVITGGNALFLPPSSFMLTYLVLPSKLHPTCVLCALGLHASSLNQAWCLFVVWHFLGECLLAIAVPLWMDQWNSNKKSIIVSQHLYLGYLEQRRGGVTTGVTLIQDSCISLEPNRTEDS